MYIRNFEWLFSNLAVAREIVGSHGMDREQLVHCFMVRDWYMIHVLYSDQLNERNVNLYDCHFHLTVQYLPGSFLAPPALRSHSDTTFSFRTIDEIVYYIPYKWTQSVCGYTRLSSGESACFQMPFKSPPFLPSSSLHAPGTQYMYNNQQPCGLAREQSPWTIQPIPILLFLLPPPPRWPLWLLTLPCSLFSSMSCPQLLPITTSENYQYLQLLIMRNWNGEIFSTLQSK